MHQELFEGLEELNHKRRRVLQIKSNCEIYFGKLKDEEFKKIARREKDRDVEPTKMMNRLLVERHQVFKR